MTKDDNVEKNEKIVSVMMINERQKAKDVVPV